MLTGEDLPDDLYQPLQEASPEVSRDALFALMVAPALIWLAYCKALYRAL